MTALQPELKVKAKETDALLKKVACDQAEADKFRAVVEKETQVVSKQAAETDAVAQDAKRDLDRALPALEAAQNALKELNKNHITEVLIFFLKYVKKASRLKSINVQRLFGLIFPTKRICVITTFTAQTFSLSKFFFTFLFMKYEYLRLKTCRSHRRESSKS